MLNSKEHIKSLRMKYASDLTPKVDILPASEQVIPDPTPFGQNMGGSKINSASIKSSSLSPARVEIFENDINIFDDTTGGGGAVVGNSASINFMRTDDETQKFTIIKRAGKNDDDENVMEMYYSKAANSGEDNYLFLGRTGIGDETNYTDFVVLHGTNSVRAEINSVHDYVSRPMIVTFDASTANSALSGVATYVLGEGENGSSLLGYSVEYLVFSDSPSFEIGDTITGNSTGAKFKVTYKIDANNYLGNHLSASYGVDFNPTTDNACTTDAGGGGSGTGNLSSTQYASASTLYITSNLDVTLGSNLIPDTDNAYDIGSASFRINDLYVGGNVVGGSKIFLSTTEVTFNAGNGGSGAGTEHTCFTTTIPGGTLGTNNAVRFKMFIRSAHIEDTEDAWLIRVKYGTNTYTLGSPTNPTTQVDGVQGYLEGYILADGATNAQKIIATCFLYESNASEFSTGTPDVWVNKINFSTEIGSAAIDSTTNQTFAISVQMTNNAINEGVMEYCLVEKIT